MVKKRLYMLLVLMAGLMVLGHVVTMHHHNYGIYCYAPSHDQHDHEDICSLEKAILLPHDQNKTEIHDDKGFSDYSLIPDTGLSVLQLACFYDIPADPGISYTSYFLTAVRFRGPPAA